MKLPRQQKRLYDHLFGRGDVLIVDLFTYMRGHNYLNDAPTVAQMQRWLGPYIARLNVRLADEGLKVEPGALKGTYRLVAV